MHQRLRGPKPRALLLSYTQILLLHQSRWRDSNPAFVRAKRADRGVVNADGHRLTRGTASSERKFSAHPSVEATRGFLCKEVPCGMRVGLRRVVAREASVTGIEPVLSVRETDVLAAVRHRQKAPTLEWRSRDVQGTPPVGAASRACRASTSERVESSQSMESNHPIRGYEPRPCTSTDCVGVIEPSGNFRAPECGSLDGLFPYEESAGPPASDPWSGSVWSRTKCLACRASTSGRAKRR